MKAPEQVKHYLREIARKGGKARAKKGHAALSDIAKRGAATRKARKISK